jgi:hypothetical protein
MVSVKLIHRRQSAVAVRRSGSWICQELVPRASVFQLKLKRVLVCAFYADKEDRVPTFCIQLEKWQLHVPSAETTL